MHKLTGDLKPLSAMEIREYVLEVKAFWVAMPLPTKVNLTYAGLVLNLDEIVRIGDQDANLEELCNTFAHALSLDEATSRHLDAWSGEDPENFSILKECVVKTEKAVQDMINADATEGTWTSTFNECNDALQAVYCV